MRITKYKFRSRNPALQRARGFALLSAIFLLVTLAALGGFMLSFSSNTNITSSQDVQGNRVYWVARSGVQWAVSSILYNSSCAGSPTSLEGFNLSISCTSDTHDENGVVRTIWHISSRATSATGVPGGLGYVERLLNATVEK